MVDSDGDSEPLLSLLTAALGAGTVPETLASLDPVHPDFALLKASLKTAKTPAQANAIRVNMERWRWMPRDLGERYVVSNVPEYLTRVVHAGTIIRSEEHTSELQSLMRISYAVFCLKTKNTNETIT